MSSWHAFLSLLNVGIFRAAHAWSSYSRVKIIPQSWASSSELAENNHSQGAGGGACMCRQPAPCNCSGDLCLHSVVCLEAMWGFWWFFGFWVFFIPPRLRWRRCTGKAGDGVDSFGHQTALPGLQFKPDVFWKSRSCMILSLTAVKLILTKPVGPWKALKHALNSEICLKFGDLHATRHPFQLAFPRGLCKPGWLLAQARGTSPSPSWEGGTHK